MAKILRPPVEILPPSVSNPLGKRKRMSQAEKETLVSHADVQESKRAKQAEALIAELPEIILVHFFEGAEGLEQVPDREDRRQALYQTLVRHGGPEGSNLGNARKALEKLRLYAQEKGVKDQGLPAKSVFVNAFLNWVDKGARESNNSSRGGVTVSTSVRAGLLFLNNHLAAPIACGKMVDAAVPRQSKSARPRQAATWPIKVYCHLEALAASPVSDSFPAIARTFVRSIVAGACLSSLRLVDVLRGHFRRVPDMADGTPVISVESSWSKDGAPIQSFSPAIGFLGPLLWWPEHLLDLEGKPFILESFSAPWG
eukprot:6210969-Pleurochrysis_carterae.AAC.1